jgi:fructose-1,6-bisphosphatase I/sedoheptulose-1,7-bisphosphatase
MEDFLQPGTKQVCAGFALYGPSTMLVLTTGDGVDGFTLDRDIGAFILTHPRMRIRPMPRVRHQRLQRALLGAAGEALCRGMPGRQDRSARQGFQHALGRLAGGRDFPHPDPRRHFHVPQGQQGCLQKPGRLRLMYEANPICLHHRAGWRPGSTTGRERVMDILPTELHQRVPLIFGSKNEVERVAGYHAEYVSGKEPERFNSPLFSTRSLFRTQ